MNYVIRYKEDEFYMYLGSARPNQPYPFSFSILDAYFYTTKRNVKETLKILKEKNPEIKFKILEV